VALTTAEDTGVEQRRQAGTYSFGMKAKRHGIQISIYWLENISNGS
jgi:hypothetical protein